MFDGQVERKRLKEYRGLDMRQSDDHMKRYDGFLFSKLLAIGTRSEGPQYFLQMWDYRDERVVSKAPRGEKDKFLQKLLGTKVSIRGRHAPDGIHYDEIAPLPVQDLLRDIDRTGLVLTLDVESECLSVNQHLSKISDGKIFQHFDLVLSVRWPQPKIWKGTCPTTQPCDFSIWRGDVEIWRWSKGKTFADIATPVYVPSDEPTEYSVTWHFAPDEIAEEGVYIARATFIASGESVEKEFEVVINRR